MLESQWAALVSKNVQDHHHEQEAKKIKLSQQRLAMR